MPWRSVKSFFMGTEIEGIYISPVPMMFAGSDSGAAKTQIRARRSASKAFSSPDARGTAQGDLDGYSQLDRIVGRVDQIPVLSRGTVPSSEQMRDQEAIRILLKFAAGGPAQLRACAAKVVRRILGIPTSAAYCRSICRTTFSPRRSPRQQGHLVYRAEDVTGSDRCGRRPCVDGDFHPRRNRRRSNATMLSDEIDNAPASIPLLNVGESKGRDFGSSQPAAEKDGEDSPITQPSNGSDIRRAPEAPAPVSARAGCPPECRSTSRSSHG